MISLNQEIDDEEYNWTEFNQEIDYEEDNWNECIIASTMLLNTSQLLLQQAVEMDNDSEEEDEDEMLERHFREENETFEDRKERRDRHKSYPRQSKRRKFDHKRAYECIMSDYLGVNALFNDGGFQMMFHISRSRFQRIMEDVAVLEHNFYCTEKQVRGKTVCSFEAKLLLPLKCIAYENPPHMVTQST